MTERSVSSHQAEENQARPSTSRADLKRKRTSRACDQCRNRKHRCDGQRPICMPCVAMGQTCSYDEGARKRGFPTGYVKSLELLFGMIFTAIPNGEKVVGELLAGAHFTLDSGGKLSLTSRLVAEGSTPRISWDESQVLKELDRRLKCLDSCGEDDDTADPDGSSSHPPTSAIDDSQPLVAVFDNILAPDDDGMLTSSMDGHSQPLLGDASPEMRRFPEESRRLLDLYFAYTHSWVPLVEKHKLFQVLFSPQDVGTPDSSGNLAVFWAVLAYSSLQERQRQEAREGNSPAQSVGSPLSTRAYDFASRLIPNEDVPAQIGHVQALVIMSLCRLRHRALKSAWRLLGQAVRMCLSELATPGQTNTPPTPHLQRLLLACFALDTFLSCSLRAPPHLRTSDIESLRPLEESGPDEWDPWVINHEGHADGSNMQTLRGVFEPLRAVSIFNNWIHIACVLNDAISQNSLLYDADSLSTLDTSLQRCREQLPPHCKQLPVLGRDEPRPLWSPQMLNLHIALEFTGNWITAAKAKHSQTAGLSMQLDIGPTYSLLSNIETSPDAWMLPPLVTCHQQKRGRVSARSDCVGDAEISWELPFASLGSEESAQGIPGRPLSTLNTGFTPLSVQMQTTPSTQNEAASYLWMPDHTVADPGPHSLPDAIGSSSWKDTCSPDHGYVGGLSILDNTDWMTEESAQFMQNLGFATWISRSPQDPNPT